MIEPDLIADVYEAGAMPSRWPAVLDRIARRFDARGGNMIRSTDGGLTLQSSERMVEITAEFDRLGWNDRNSRVSRLIERQPYPGFLSDSDLHSDEELATLPMYAEFLNPRGAAAGSGTMIQGSRDDALIVAIEGFPDHAASRAAAPFLDALRPHLARAAMLSARIEQERRLAAVAALNVIGVPAALLDGRSRVREANAAFAAMHPTADKVLGDGNGSALGRSVPLRDVDGRARAALHLMPIAGDARDLFPGMGGIAIIADGTNRRMPGADLLQALFDLTPAEARIARQLAGGASPAAIARDVTCSLATVRTHLKRVFQKTGTSRQADLASLLGGFAPVAVLPHMDDAGSDGSG